MALSAAREQHVLQLANENRVCLAKRQNYNAKLKLVNNRLTVSVDETLPLVQLQHDLALLATTTMM
eukprot:11344016-Ditylum_brightwellii.AAC.1